MAEGRGTTSKLAELHGLKMGGIKKTTYIQWDDASSTWPVRVSREGRSCRSKISSWNTRVFCWKNPPEVVQQVFWSSMHLFVLLVLLPVQLMLPRARSVVLGPGCSPPQNKAHLDVPGRKWMDQMVNGSIGLFHLLINGVYWGHNPFTNNLLTSCDIQVGGGFIFFSFHPEPWGNDPIWRAYWHIFQMGWFNHQLEQLNAFGEKINLQAKVKQQKHIIFFACATAKASSWEHPCWSSGV